MKSYERVFSYTKENEEPEVRDVLVIRETEEALGGYDMKYLTEDEKSRVKNIFREHEIINNFDFDRTKKDTSMMTDLEKEIKVLNKAWRRFNKASIINIVKD